MDWKLPKLTYVVLDTGCLVSECGQLLVVGLAISAERVVLDFELFHPFHDRRLCRTRATFRTGEPLIRMGELHFKALFKEVILQ